MHVQSNLRFVSSRELTGRCPMSSVCGLPSSYLHAKSQELHCFASRLLFSKLNIPLCNLDLSYPNFQLSFPKQARFESPGRCSRDGPNCFAPSLSNLFDSRSSDSKTMVE